MSRYRVTGSGSHWAVLDGGRTIATFSTWYRAERRAEALEQADRIRSRRCLTCGATFISEGPHNRLCPACRQKSLYDGAA